MMRRSLLIPVLLVASPTSLFAQQGQDTLRHERFSAHGQTTVVWQWKAPFDAPYTGPHSLVARADTGTTITTTVFLGASLWHGAHVFFNPELAGGGGLSGTFGVASATNGEAFRVGDPHPKGYVARIFLRQDFALGDEQEVEASGPNALAGTRPKDRLTLTVGKICLADLFDANAHSHDPRTQFMSWGLMDNGAWDYAANVRGYTPAAAVELFRGDHEMRIALALLPKEANGADMQWDLGRSRAIVAEYVRHFTVNGRAGSVGLLGFHNTAPMGDYRASLALADPGTAPSIVATRLDGRTKYGFMLNVEQELTQDLGMFLRAGWSDGRKETWAFTEIDRSISGGLVLGGGRWKRPEDRIGLGFVASGLSDPHRDYLAAGGLGFMLGDGALDYAVERLAELYYSLNLVPSSLWISGAYQLIMAPGYNHARGPANVFSMRVHMAI